MSSLSGNMKFCLGICLLSSSILISTSYAAPLAPTNTSVTAESTTELTVSWTPNGNSNQDSFRVTYNKVGLTPVTAAGCTSSPCIIDVSSQGSPGSQFLITVYAVSNGVASAGATAYGNTKPEAPGDLTVWMASSNTLVLLSTVPSGSTIESTNIVVSPTLPSYNVNVAQEGQNYVITLSGLYAGGRYDIEFSTQSGQAESDKVRGAFYSKPPTPSAPSRQSATTNSLNVTWTQPATGELDKYVIAIVGGESKNLSNIVEKKVIFMGLVAGRTYSVSLRTVVGTGASEVWSDPATASMTIKPLPATGIVLKERTTNSLTVTWNAPTDGVFGSFKASVSGVLGSMKTVQAGSTYEPIFSSLTPGTEFTVEIITVSGDQNSEVTEAKFYTVPNGPSNLQQSAVDNWTITITWTSPTRGNWDKYEVRITPEGGSETKSALTKVATTIQFAGLQPATRYTIKLRTVVSTVSGADQTLIVLTNPNPPKDITFSNKDTTSVAIQWTPPGHAVDRYKYAAIKTVGSVLAAFGMSSSTSAIMSNLEPGATYDVSVISQRDTGLGTISESEPLNSKVTMVPNEVFNFGVKDTGQKYIEVQWGNPANEYSSFKLTIDSQNAVSVNRGINTYKFTGLNPGQSYTIIMKTFSNSVESPGLSRTFQTNPSSVQDLNIGTVTSTSIPVSWAEPTGTVITSYELSISPNDGQLQLPIQVNKESHRFYIFNDLKPGRTYTVRINVKAGQFTSSPVSKTVTTKPLPVRNLGASPGTVQTTAFQIQWSVDQRSQQQSFTVKYVQADGGNIVERSVAGQGLSYTSNIDKLRPGRTYTVEVYAIINNVNGESVSLNQTTKPSRVATFTATGTGTTVDLTWVPYVQSVQDSYELIYRGQIQATSWTIAQKKTDTSATIENLFPGDKYTFQLVVVSNDQKSDIKEVQKVTTPLPPPGLTVEEVTTSTIRVVWGYDSTKTHNTQYKIYQSLTANSNPQIVGTTSVHSRTVTVSGLTSGGNYTISVYSMSFDDIGSLTASSVRATVKPVITSTLSDDRDETTNITAVVSYTESTTGVFDKYKINITVGSEIKSQVKDKDDQVRKASFGGLVPGTRYQISAITISGAQESTAMTTYIVTKPNPPLITCKSYQDGIKVIMIKTFGEVHSFYVECVGPNCPPSPVRINVNQGQPSEHTFQSLKSYTDYSVKVKSEVVNGADSKTSIEATRTCSTSYLAPEAVDTFTFGDMKPYEVTLFWDEPTVPNGVLTGYLITYQGTKQNAPETEEIAVPIEDPNVNERTITDLKAGYTYVFWIQAKTVDYGDKKILTLTLPIESPWINLTLYEQSKPKQLKVTHNSVDMEFFNPFTHKNGEITGYTVIVCNNPKQINQLDDVTADWETAIIDNPISPYAAIYKCPDLFLVGNACWDVSGRSKRATEDRVVVRVGGDEKCDLRPDYCNGPLKPDRPYYILLRAYTENGLFSDSPLSDPVITDKKPAEEDREPSQEQSGLPGAAIGGIVASAILATILIAIIVVVVMRRRGSCQKESEPPPSGEGDQEYYNTGQDRHKQKGLPSEPQTHVYEMPAESATYETIDDKQYSHLTLDHYEN